MSICLLPPFYYPSGFSSSFPLYQCGKLVISGCFIPLISYTHSTSLINPIPYHSLTSINLLFDLLYNDIPTLAPALVFPEQYSFIDLKLRPISLATACCPQQCSSPFPTHTHSFPSNPPLWAFLWLLPCWSTPSSLCSLIHLLTTHRAITTSLMLSISLTALAFIFWFICIFWWYLSSGFKCLDSKSIRHMNYILCILSFSWFTPLMSKWMLIKGKCTSPPYHCQHFLIL